MPNDSVKVPSQIFRWFERMKSNYEANIQAVLSKFEKNNEQQQARTDHQHQQVVSAKDAQIEQLEKQVLYYQEQLAAQQQTNAQLNSRYDAIIGCLLTEKRDLTDIRQVFEEDNESIIEPIGDALPNDNDISGAEDMFESAICYRNNQEYKQAFSLFEQAAKQLNAKAMGALGRAYFLAEGIEENHSLGLAWLINAADLGLPQAIERVAHFKSADPFLYEQACLLAKSL